MTALCAALWLSSWIWESRVRIGSYSFVHKHGTLAYVRSGETGLGDATRTIALRHAFLWNRVDDHVDPKWGLSSNRIALGVAAPATRVFVDYLIAMILFGLWPACHACVESLYHRSRERRGLCRRCGFDLRLNRRRCPECGFSLWRRDRSVIDREWWLSASTKAAAIGLLLLLPASILGGWLGWGYSVERSQLRKLAKVATYVKTAPVGPSSISDAARRLHLRFFERVTSLSLDVTGTDKDLAQLSLLRNLQDLSLTNSVVTDAGLVHLKKLHHLRTLNLAGTGVSDRGMAFLASLTNLERVDVTGTKVVRAHVLRRARPDLVVDGLPSALPISVVARAPAQPASPPRPVVRRVNRLRAAKKATRPAPVKKVAPVDDRSGFSLAVTKPLVVIRRNTGIPDRRSLLPGQTSTRVKNTGTQSPDPSSFAKVTDAPVAPPLFFDTRTRRVTHVSPRDPLHRKRTTVPDPELTRTSWLDTSFVTATASDPGTAAQMRENEYRQTAAARAQPGWVQTGSVAAPIESGPRQPTLFDLAGTGLQMSPAPRSTSTSTSSNVDLAGYPQFRHQLDAPMIPAWTGRPSTTKFNVRGGPGTRLFNERQWLPPIRTGGSIDAGTRRFSSGPWPSAFPTGPASDGAHNLFAPGNDAVADHRVR